MRFSIKGIWYDAPTYAEARRMAAAAEQAAQPAAPAQAPQPATRRFEVEGRWYTAATYAMARTMHRTYLANQAPAAPAPAVIPPAPPTTFTPRLTPQANFVGRSTVRYGVGEIIDLGFTTAPPNLTAGSFGGLTWVVVSGPATVVNDHGDVGTGRLMCGASSGVVKLELRVPGAAPARKVVKQFQIVRPDDVVFARDMTAGTFHRNTRPSAGFRAITYLRPTDVSFSRLEYREGGATFEGTGAFARREVTRAELATDYDVIHPVRQTDNVGRTVWYNCNGGDDINNGTRVAGTDDMQSGPVPVLGQPGQFKWKIPQLGRVRGTQNDFIIKVLDHTETVTAAGRMTIAKGGVTVSHDLNDPNSDI